MSQDGPEQDREVAVQREVARVALAGADGFALAGSGAIREHGMIERPTEDVDLFTASQDVAAFGVAVDQVTEQLRGSGYRVEQSRRAAQFARLHVATEDGLQLDVDLGVDWRQDDPVFLGVGPVLSVADAVGNKVSALYSRGEARDYLDVDAIRASGPVQRRPADDRGRRTRRGFRARHVRPAARCGEPAATGAGRPVRSDR